VLPGDQRAHLGPLVVAGADPELADPLGDLRDQLVADRVDRDQHRDRHAALPGRAESGRDGRVHPIIGGAQTGFWLGPSVLDHVTPEMSCYTDEIFGPVLSVLRAPTYEEAVDLVNTSPYGNGTAVFTSSGHAARSFQRAVHVGMIGVNVPIPVPVAYYTFGGWKRSGFGDLNQHGPDSIRFYSRTKTVTARWPSGIKDGAQFSIPTMN